MYIWTQTSPKNFRFLILMILMIYRKSCNYVKGTSSFHQILMKVFMDLKQNNNKFYWLTLEILLNQKEMLDIQKICKQNKIFTIQI